jgi:hypothetical protein
LPSERQVAQVERRIGASLPAEYRQFILEFNGGGFADPDIEPPIGQINCPLDCLNVLYGIRAVDASNELASEKSLNLFVDNEPISLLPIGYTLMGNLLYLVMRGEHMGHIGLKKMDVQDSYLLASGISRFFRLLKENTDV